jgi:hypothetical protein
MERIMAEQEKETIRIDHELYLRLREHCDREGIRFVDFVENSLEDALARETVIKALEDEIESLRRKAVKYDYAFNRGFQQGFAYFYQMLMGPNLPPAAEEELKIVKKFPAVAPKGEQLSLL